MQKLFYDSASQIAGPLAKCLEARARFSRFNCNFLISVSQLQPALVHVINCNSNDGPSAAAYLTFVSFRQQACVPLVLRQQQTLPWPLLASPVSQQGRRVPLVAASRRRLSQQQQ